MKNYKLSLITARNFLQYCLDRRIYVFLARAFKWGEVDLAPKGIQDSPKNLVEDFRDTFFAKEILESNFSLVIRRINWEERIFDQYRHDDPAIADKDFYCLTSSNHVFKCISNNNGATSTVEPNTVSATMFETADGYVWRYLFTVNGDDYLKFVTPDWIPVKEIHSSQTGYENQYASQVGAVVGTVDRVDIVQSGQKYSSGTTIAIQGDGQDATATLEVHPTTGAITSIKVTNHGKGYTWANAVITDPQAVPGTGAFTIVALSPQYGHGYNPAEELFATHVMATCKIEGDEGGQIKGDTSYRKFLLVSDPQLKDGSFATDYRYSNTSSVTLSGISGEFVVGEKIVFANGSGYVSFIEGTKLHLSGLEGIPSGVVTGETSTATGTVTAFAEGTFKLAGSVILRSYFDPKTKLQADSIEARPIFSF